MKILVTGGTGFVGKNLCRFLLNKGHKLTVLSRKPETVTSFFGESVKGISQLEQLTEQDQFDAIINLAGEGIVDSRWTQSRKQKLLDSRIGVTQQLVEYISRATYKPDVLISGSAIGYYGNKGSVLLNENSHPSEDFAHELCDMWEDAANEAEKLGVRVCVLRIGLVIGEDGGFLKRMLPPFKWGLGGRIGHGEQYMSWIHRDDLIALIDKLLNTKLLHGVFNGTAPHPVTNAEFSQILAKQLNRPACLPVPALVLKVLLGEMSELLLGGQRVMPARIEKAGFKFKYLTLEQALKSVL